MRSLSLTNCFYLRLIMKPRIDSPLFSKCFQNLDEFSIPEESLYLYGISISDQREHWISKRGHRNISKIVDQTKASFATDDGKIIGLRNSQHFKDFWREHQLKVVYLDITGLANHVWIPLLRSAVSMKISIIIVYSEPVEYRLSIAPTEGKIFDLSESIEGIEPLPGIASLSDDFSVDECFIPLLGFEGNRLAHIIENFQPPREKIFPIIGVPGFKVEYPFATFHGNRVSLTDTHAWKNARYASANNPFCVCYLLEEIAMEFPHDVLKIALIGTKPHALGAILFWISSQRRIEFIYDYPVRRPKRTEGVERVLIYYVNEFLSPRH